MIVYLYQLLYILMFAIYLAEQITWLYGNNSYYK